MKGLFSSTGLSFIFCLVLIISACTSSRTTSTSTGGTTAMNALTKDDIQQGWRLLFDGKTFTGWRGIGRQEVPPGHWTIEDGTIHKRASGNVPVAADGQPVTGGDLMTIDTFENFELAFDWKISPGGNSGVKYNVSEEMSMGNTLASRAALGFEYQVLDDERHADASMGDGNNRKASALYDLLAPAADRQVNPAGEWNHGRIVFRGRHGEHWLNGVKVLEYDLDSPDFADRFARSKYVNIKGFADKRKGHIILQDHNDDAWYRNIKIRELTAP